MNILKTSLTLWRATAATDSLHPTYLTFKAINSNNTTCRE